MTNAKIEWEQAYRHVRMYAAGYWPSPLKMSKSVEWYAVASFLDRENAAIAMANCGRFMRLRRLERSVAPECAIVRPLP